MFTATEVNLIITSAVGFRRPSYAVSAPKPIMTTTYTLNDVAQPDTISFSNTRIVSVSTVSDFTLYPGSTSSAQIVGITNLGNSTLTLVSPYFKYSINGLLPVFNIAPSSLLNSLPPTIPPGQTGTFTLAYYGENTGEFSNWVIIVSDSDASQYKFVTKQIVSDQFNATVTPTSFSTNINNVNERSSATYTIVPLVNQVERPDIVIGATYTLTGSPGWSIIGTGTNSVTVEFEAGAVNNNTGTYVAQLLIESDAGSYVANNTAVVNIDYTKNYNIISWQSPVSSHNSIIGISYDVAENDFGDPEKVLTIGAGVGSAGTPIYDQGGDAYLDMSSLSLGGDGLDEPFPYWAEVYQFKGLGTGTAATYLSGAKNDDGDYIHQKKSAEGLAYSRYFGYERSLGSMFIVKDDGFGNLRITLNGLREYSGDEDFDVTLDNFTRAFYYYSERDVGGGRIINLTQYPFEAGPVISVANTSTTPLPQGETRTKFFLGFDAISTSTWTAVTSIVPIPR